MSIEQRWYSREEQNKERSIPEKSQQRRSEIKIGVIHKDVLNQSDLHNTRQKILPKIVLLHFLCYSYTAFLHHLVISTPIPFTLCHANHWFVTPYIFWKEKATAKQTPNPRPLTTYLIHDIVNIPSILPPQVNHKQSYSSPHPYQNKLVRPKLQSGVKIWKIAQQKQHNSKQHKTQGNSSLSYLTLRDVRYITSTWVK